MLYLIKQCKETIVILSMRERNVTNLLQKFPLFQFTFFYGISPFLSLIYNV